MNFDQFSFDPRIAAGVKGAGYTTPTPIQEQAIPVVLEGRDVLGPGANRHRQDRSFRTAYPAASDQGPARTRSVP